MGKNGMIQWAPGTRLQRLNRVLNDDQYRRNFLKSAKGSTEKDHSVRLIKEGDFLVIGDTIQIAGKVQGESVLVGPHKYGLSYCRRIPQHAEELVKWLFQNARTPWIDFRVEVVPVKLEPHPFADHLSLVRVYGLQVVVRTEEFKETTRGIFIPPEARLPNTPRWEWLTPQERRRVKPKKIRGIMSYGILDPYKGIFPIGTDLSASEGIRHRKYPY